MGSLIFLTLTYSCKKFLDIQPVGSLSNAVLANKAGVDGLLIGAYSMLDGWTNTSKFSSWDGSIDNWTFGGIGSDDAYKGSNTTDQPPASPIENHSVDASNEYLEGKWEIVYNSIQRANDVIRELPLVKDGSVSAAYAAEVTAEARFLRGVYHLEAAKLWRNVPYVDETITYGNGNYNVPNSGPIWTQIEGDFSAAMAVLPKTQPQIGRANYYAAEAFLAKAYMFDHQYPKALPLLTDLINNGQTSGGVKYALGPYENNFNASTKNGPESVFAVQMTVNDGSGGNNGNAGDILNFPGGTYTSGSSSFYHPSYSLANSFKVDANGLPMFGTDANGLPAYDTQNLKNDHGLSPTDPFTPPTDALDSRIDWTLGRRGIPYLDWALCGGEAWSHGDVCSYNPIKNVFWHAAQATTSDTGQGWDPNQDVANNYNLIRFADVILWRAECEVEANDLPDAEADVNKVRTRAADPTGWVHTYVDNTDPSKGFTTTPAANYKVGLYSGQFAANGQDYARQAVLMERKLEFGMEGMRFFDLQRYDGLYGGKGGSGYMADVLNAYIKADTRIFNPVLNGHTFTKGKNELYPIPQIQIDFEAGKLKQNPQY
ncbi:MAG TPA: RagB/SusD family nutrient uptake outer membrane protein [Mucilaginibacter sp.]|nr:RagB/SusD family nutrient uptake outer membrane protein [Mucilaginibacter sp.]